MANLLLLLTAAVCGLTKLKNSLRRWLRNRGY